MKNTPLKPLQLISLDSKKRSPPYAGLCVNAQAIAWLQGVSQDRHLGVVSVVGKYRTGKSYILNRVLLEQNHGFEVGPTINACTKGLWVWPELHAHPTDSSLAYLVMDTEGLGSLEEGEQTDTKIFLMALLLSSYFIYNSVGSIDEKALQNLSLIVNLSRMLQQGDPKTMSDILACFPHFTWLVRDFALRLEDESGHPITSSQYLENALRLQKGNSELVQRKNAVRKDLMAFFPKRDCFLLIRPVDDESKLQNMSKLSDSELRPQFVELVQQFRGRVLNQLHKKCFKGKPCSPGMFIELCQFFCEAINEGRLPEVESSWALVCKAESNRLLRRTIALFDSFIQPYACVPPRQLNLKELEAKSHAKLAELVQHIDKVGLGDKHEQKRALQEHAHSAYEKVFRKAAESHGEQIDEDFQALVGDLERQVTQQHLHSIFDIT